MFNFSPLTFCKTNGRGYWSEAVRDVNITKCGVAYINDEGDFGELRVYFNTKTWDVKELGLIYTDAQFMKDFKAILKTKLGFTDKELKQISYSEQGMQGNTYVSMDLLGADVINKFNSLVPTLA